MEERNQRRGEPTLGDLATAYVESEAEGKNRPHTIRDDSAWQRRSSAQRSVVIA